MGVLQEVFKSGGMSKERVRSDMLIERASESKKRLHSPFVTKSAEFDESKHPRADDGKFGSGGGGKPADAKAAPPEAPHPRLEQLFDAHADTLKISKQWLRDGLDAGQSPTQILESILHPDPESGINPAEVFQSSDKLYQKIHARAEALPEADDDWEDAVNEWFAHKIGTLAEKRKDEILSTLRRLAGGKGIASPFVTKSSQWDENKHNRDGGKFSSQQGAGAAPQAQGQPAATTAPDKTPQYVSQLKEKFGEQALAKVTAMKAKVAGDPAKVAALEKIEAALQPQGQQAATGSLLPNAAKEGLAPHAIERAEKYLASLGPPPPPPAADMKRLYRGTIAGETPHESAFWSDDRGLAGVVIPFARSAGRNLVYVDVPKDIKELSGAVTDGEYQIPAQYRSQAKVWGKPEQQKQSQAQGGISSPFGKSKQADPVKSWSDRAKEMPGKMLDAAKTKAKAKFAQLETRYGRKTAVAIMAAGIAGLPLPVPGSSFITAAPVVAVAEMVRYFKGDSKTLDNAEVDVESLGKEFIESIVAEFEKEQGGGKALADMMTKGIASPFGRGA